MATLWWHTRDAKFRRATMPLLRDCAPSIARRTEGLHYACGSQEIRQRSASPAGVDQAAGQVCECGRCQPHYCAASCQRRVLVLPGWCSRCSTLRERSQRRQRLWRLALCHALAADRGSCGKCGLGVAYSWPRNHLRLMTVCWSGDEVSQLIECFSYQSFRARPIRCVGQVYALDKDASHTTHNTPKLH